MGNTTHLWLLYRLQPPAPAALSWPWIAALLKRLSPRRLLPVLADPDARAAAETQARLLGRRLPDAMGCRAVFAEGDPSPAQAASEVGSRERVLLLPMAPQSGVGAEALVAEARAALGGRGSVSVIPTLGPGLLLEAQAERVRAALADLPPGVAYEVIFAASAPVDAGLAAHIAAAAGLIRPHHLAILPAQGLGWRANTLGRRLRDLGARRVSAVVVVGLDSAIDTPALRHLLDVALPAAARAAGIATVVRARPLGDRPTFIRALLAAVAPEDEPIM